MAAFTYILHSRTIGRFYVGHTTEEVAERLRKHLSAHDGYTAKAKDWLVVHVEEFPTKALAHQREREIKSWKNRMRILILIGAGSGHPA